MTAIIIIGGVLLYLIILFVIWSFCVVAARADETMERWRKK